MSAFLLDTNVISETARKKPDSRLLAYEYLEHRFDACVRLLAGVVFLIDRGLATGITIYAPPIAHARDEGDDQGAGGHDAQSNDETAAAADAIGVRAEDDGTERAHEGAGAEAAEGPQQRGELAAGGEERLRDAGG
jgi:hypothetical protein